MLRHRQTEQDPLMDPKTLMRASAPLGRILANQETVTELALEMGLIDTTDISFAKKVFDADFAQDTMEGLE